MKLSKLIAYLEELKASYGDVNVYQASSTGDGWGRMREECIGPRTIYKVIDATEENKKDPFNTRNIDTAREHDGGIAFMEWTWRDELCYGEFHPEYGIKDDE